MLPYQIIEKKSYGMELTPEEITFFVNGYTQNAIPDYQMSALLMAIFIKGMTNEEMLALTKVMLESGDRLDFSGAEGFVADKHSTGGVGDKVSLILAPILAVLGIKIPMISGRGLGHTGGTLDKLESIPGFNVNLSADQFHDMVLSNGVSLIGQTQNICPADKKLYALRDVTATVRSIPLISASIMSKKIAEGIQGLVLDVKTGSGAFMQTYDDSKALADSLVAIGQLYGIHTTALITDMNQPLGRYIGNWLEVEESLACLRGEGPADLMEVTFALGNEILKMADHSLSDDDALKKQQGVIDDGSALEKFIATARLHGGDPKVLEKPELHSKASLQVDFKAAHSGYLQAVDTMQLGFLGIELDAGRRQSSDVIDPDTGFVIHKRLGDKIQAGDALITIHANKKTTLDSVLTQLDQVFEIGEETVEMPKLVYKQIG
ncbi:MAG TPA: thymidine phosphorylase [Candidatus Marinimicrobia bacterium]|nr:MAG: thymidine phosphorylase [Candidatus Marinimicrobia bacterium CG1_02_48_14]PJA52965.1 MAG: thymidine phosphorylase [Candidatus Marinimicrobia bacterium CG_4_9_14_3_um_filter_48_9]HCW76821.1 thymidine phosphorylase [Candidatus Neomarinimicrobiota bacterium]